MKYIAIKDVRIHGEAGTHHLRGDIYEIRAYAGKRQYRILYATEGKSDQVLLSIHASSRGRGRYQDVTSI